MTTLQLITLAIACYGALLSTVALLRQLLNDRPRLRVSFSTAIPVYEGRTGDAYVVLTVVNAGQRQAVVSYITIELPGGRTLALTGAGTPLPATLAQGQTATAQVRYQDLGQALLSEGYQGKVSIRPMCKDTTGAAYYGKPWKIGGAEFARM